MTRHQSVGSLPTPWLSLVRMFSVDVASMADSNQFEMPRHSIKDQVELCPSLLLQVSDLNRY
jgi:hypothetical protein